MKKGVVLAVAMLGVALVGCSSKEKAISDVKDSVISSKDTLTEEEKKASIDSSMESVLAEYQDVLDNVEYYDYGLETWEVGDQYIYSGDRDSLDNASITVEGVTCVFKDGLKSFLDNGWYFVKTDRSHERLSEEEVLSEINEYGENIDENGIAQLHFGFSHLNIRYDYAEGGYIELDVDSGLMQPYEGMNWKDLPIAEVRVVDFESAEGYGSRPEYAFNLPIGTVTSGEWFDEVMDLMGYEYVNPLYIEKGYATVYWRDHYAKDEGDYDVEVQFTFIDGQFEEFEYTISYGY